jgi:hypothetical protein
MLSFLFLVRIFGHPAQIVHRIVDNPAFNQSEEAT